MTQPVGPVPVTVLPPAQVRYPWQAVVRTVLQGLLASASVLPWLVQAFQSAYAGTPVSGWAGLASGQFLVAIALLTRVMAYPPVNAFLTKWGLGAKPSAAPEDFSADPPGRHSAPPLPS